jgi:triosephosphate isomerase
MRDTTMRPRIVAGNWKMHTTRETGRQLASGIVKGLGGDDRVGVILCPPFPYLISVGEVLAGSKVALGAQNCHDQPKGAFTGEISPAMLLDVGCRYVIIGHSERRHIMGETDAMVNRKTRAALVAGLEVILCVGETLAERQEGRAEEVFFRQVATALSGLEAAALSHLTLAYEPVWAIGTGHTATPDQVQTAHTCIREHIGKQFGEKEADALPILYGGSVKADNARELFVRPNVDGGLIGGASLEIENFLGIVRAAL